MPRAQPQGFLGYEVGSPGNPGRISWGPPSSGYNQVNTGLTIMQLGGWATISGYFGPRRVVPLAKWQKGALLDDNVWQAQECFWVKAPVLVQELVPGPPGSGVVCWGRVVFFCPNLRVSKPKCLLRVRSIKYQTDCDCKKAFFRLKHLNTMLS